MLFSRSVLLKVIFLLLVAHLRAQEDYGLDESDHSEYGLGSEHEHPDYSKYYSVDNSAPLVTGQHNAGTGFVSPADFTTFFNTNPIAIGESNKQAITIPSVSFVPQQHQLIAGRSNIAPAQGLAEYYSASTPVRDFFEESQQKRLANEQINNQGYAKPGPSYISHQISVPTNLNELKRPSGIEINSNPHESRKEDYIEAFAPNDGSSGKDSIEQKIAAYKFLPQVLENTKPQINYDVGKSSSTVSQYPIATGFSTSPGENLTPYQKYSFQPVTGVATDWSSKSVDAPFPKAKPFNPNYEKITKPSTSIETEQTENIPSHLKSRSCRKLTRPASEGSEEMNCFVCENGETKSKYTQCSYTSEKEPEQYYHGNSERYSVPAKDPDSFRYKRHASPKSTKDPYDFIRERSRKTFEEPTIPKDYNLGFQYQPETYDESRRELSYSEKQSEEIKNNPKNCKKVDKKGMTCTVCKNPETGGNYEQCSYTSEPKENKYAYVTEKKYDSDDPEETKVSPQTKEVEPSSSEFGKKTIKDSESLEENDEAPESPKANDEYENKYSKYDADEETRDKYRSSKFKPSESQRHSKKDNYHAPSDFIKSGSKQKNAEDDESTDESKHYDFDEYHYKLFPELSKQEEAKDESEQEYQIPAASKQNVEEVLAEFSKKDRSTCKKSEKNGMTCYLCVDKNKIQHEECMYVQESKPKSSHVAYHELKGIKKVDDEEETDQSKIVESKSKLPKKVSITAPLNLEASASEDSVTKLLYNPRLKHPKKRSTKKSSKSKVSNESTPKTPAEFEVSDEEGAFSAETKPVYSKSHAAKLPKYMVDKSEFEKEFDEFSGSN